MTVVVTGAGGQAGRALMRRLPGACGLTRAELDITDEAAVRNFDWSGVHALINAAAYTKVDEAETETGKILAQRVNVDGTTHLARVAGIRKIVFVQISTEYVFGDYSSGPQTESELTAPLGVYGRTKVDGDWAAQRVKRHFVVRTSWVVGDGPNFVRTMAARAAAGQKSVVVNDQIGRLTLADDLAAGIVHLIESEAPYGCYNLSGGGVPASWAEVAREVYRLTGHDPGDVSETTTAAYYADKPGAARRPLNSVLDLRRIQGTGFKPPDWRKSLADYLSV